MKGTAPVTLLIADDDLDDRNLLKEAFVETRLACDLRFVTDGEELMDYLHRRGKFADAAPRPGLILLDLNMPKKDGREALAEIKMDPGLHVIPVVVFTTSKAEDDIERCYRLGANSFITKPITFTDLVNVTREVGQYWLNLVEIPPGA